MYPTKSLETLIRKKALDQLIKRKIKDSYHAYFQNLLGLEDGAVIDSKKLFSSLNNSRQDQQGTQPLKEDDKVITGMVGNAHNRQFLSIFTPKSPLNLERLTQMELQDFVDPGIMDPATVTAEFQTTNLCCPTQTYR